MHCRRADDVYYFTAPWVIKAITPMHTDNSLSYQITSIVISFFFWFTHIDHQPPTDLAGLSRSVLLQVLQNILLHSVLAVRTQSFKRCVAPLWCACKKKKKNSLQWSSLHFTMWSKAPKAAWKWGHLVGARAAVWMERATYNSSLLSNTSDKTASHFLKFTGAFSYQQSWGNSENV